MECFEVSLLDHDRTIPYIFAFFSLFLIFCDPRRAESCDPNSYQRRGTIDKQWTTIRDSSPEYAQHALLVLLGDLAGEAGK